MKTSKKIFGIALAPAFGLAATLNAQSLYILDVGNPGGGTNPPSGSVGEYGLDGSTVNASLISGLNTAESIAISGSDMFIDNFTANTIAEYTTSGTLVNASLISGLNNPIGDLCKSLLNVR